MKNIAKSAFIALAVICLSFTQGFAFAADFTSQVQSTQSAGSDISTGEGISLSETFGKLKAFGSSVYDSGSTKVAQVAQGFKTPFKIGDNVTAAPVETVSVGGASSISNNTAETHTTVAKVEPASTYSRTRCKTVKVNKSTEDKICETVNLSSNEGTRYFQ